MTLVDTQCPLNNLAYEYPFSSQLPLGLEDRGVSITVNTARGAF